MGDKLENAVEILASVAVVGGLIWVGGDLYAWLVDHYMLFTLLLIGLPILTAFAVYNNSHHLSPNMLAEMLSTTVGVVVLGWATLTVFVMAIGTVKDAHSYHHGVCWQMGEWPNKDEKVLYFGCAPGRWDSFAKDNNLYCDPLVTDEGPDVFDPGEWATIKRLGLDNVDSYPIGVFRCTEVPREEP